jgi:hypothetical protein
MLRPPENDDELDKFGFECVANVLGGARLELSRRLRAAGAALVTGTPGTFFLIAVALVVALLVVAGVDVDFFAVVLMMVHFLFVSG